MPDATPAATPDAPAAVSSAPAPESREPAANGVPRRGKTLPHFDLPHLLKPSQWGLRLRILLVAGVLLSVGMLSLIGFEAWQLSSSMERGVQERLKLLEHWMHDEIRTRMDGLTASVSSLVNLPEITEAMEKKDREALKTFILPYADKLRVATGNTSLYFHFHTPASVSLLRTWDIHRYGDDLSKTRFMVVRVNRELAPFSGLELGQGGTVIRSIAPVFHQGRHVGSVEAAMNIVDALQRLTLPQDYGIVFVIDKKFKGLWDGGIERAAFDNWIMVKSLGDADAHLADKALEAGPATGRVDNFLFRIIPVDDFQGRQVGSLVLTYNAGAVVQQNAMKTFWFGLLAVVGALSMWLVLYMNVRRVMKFLERLKKIILASHGSDFVERFDSDHVHCLEVLRCPNKECVVHKNPNLVCYLETGTEAVSPTLRGTCLFLNKYGTCTSCPVYIARCGDELAEMKNLVNTMMRIWGVFLGRVGGLLNEVLRHQQGHQQAMPSLDQVSGYLEEMARLTAFSHDLQGVNNIAEVYHQLDHVFHTHFRLSAYAVVEVVPGQNRMELVLDRGGFCQHMSPDVLHNSSLCRARRGAEEVASHPNPVLCPYFNIDTDKHVRCCLPMVMGGRVGAVFSFLFPKAEWDPNRKRLVMLRKYLDESAPVLSSLRLLEASKEQSLRDALTDCYNRRYLDEYLPNLESLSKRECRKVAILMADLDFFKQVNDQYGHQAGDAVLRQVAQIIRRSLRESDLLVRYGGEEFLILLHEPTEGGALFAAEKIRAAVEGTAFHLPDGQQITKTMSLGLAEYPEHGDTLYKVIKYADVALYAAKDAGRNKVLRFEPEMWQQDSY